MVAIKGLVVVATILSLAADDGSFFSSRVFRPDPMPRQIEWKEVPPPDPVQVTTADGFVISGYRWKARCKPHIAMVFFHGNGGNRFTAADLVAPMRRDNVDLIVASYRGYGGNPGKPSEEGLYQDGAAFIRLAQGSDPSKLYLFGFSLGAAVALHLGPELGADGLVTLGAFSSLKSVTPPIARALMPYKFDNAAAVQRLQSPLLVLHGTADEMIPLEEAIKLKEAAGTRAQLIRLKGAPHNVALDQMASRLWEEIAKMPESSQLSKVPAPGNAQSVTALEACKDLKSPNLAKVATHKQ